MKQNIIIILLTVFLYHKGNSQFLVYPPETARGDLFHTLLPQTINNQFRFLVLRDNNNLTAAREKHQILTYDFSGQFIDSINIIKGFVPISFPEKNKNHYYWSSLYLDTNVTQSSTQDAFILKLDSNLNYVAKKRISNTVNNAAEWPSNVIEINNKFFVAVKNQATDELKLYKLDTLLNKIDSMFFHGAYAVEIRKTPQNNILIAGSGFTPISNIGSGGAQQIIVDTMLNITNQFNLDSLTYVTAGGSIITGCSQQVGVVSINGFKIIPITSSKNFIIGRYSIVYNANCNNRYNIVHSVINNTNQIINTTLISDNIRDVMYADNVNFSDFKNNYLYTVGSEGYFGWLLANTNTSILVTKSDTMGNLIWKKRYGDDMYYRPTSIIQTLDSGFLVSGIRYDYQNTLYPNVGQSFILRLNKNGDVLSTGIQEHGSINYSSFSCFPNPTKDVIYFDVPFISNYQIEIYDALGKIVYSNKNYGNKTLVNTESFSTGVYIFKIKTSESYSSGKFIKE